jgi:hypothetical protein
MKKKRVAIYYDNRFGRNDGAPLYYWNVLKKDDSVDLVHLLPEGDTSNFGKFDYHLWIDWGEDGLPWKEWEPPKDGGKLIYVASDTHLGREYRYNKADKADFAFFNQLEATNDWEIKYKKKATWLPHAFEPQAYPRYKKIKKYDVCFIGHIQEVENYNGMTRLEALDVLFKAFPNFYFGARNPVFPDKHLFEHTASIFCESKIVFNISIKDDINMRIFETMGTGSFLVTNYIPTLDKLFEDGMHLVTYKNYKEMISLIDYYIRHDQERELIAKTGYNDVIAHHTYQKRWEKIKEVIKF